MADNFHFDMTGVKLSSALLCIMPGDHQRVTHYRSEPTRLTLYWAEPRKPEAIPFIAPLDREGVEPMIRIWLESAAQYPSEPSHDGDSSKGFRIFNEAWNRVGNEWEALCAVEPVWLWYGK